MYVLTLDEPFQPQPPDFLNQTTLPVLRRLRQDPQFRLLPFQSRVGIIVFQRMPQDGLADPRREYSGRERTQREGRPKLEVK